MYDKKKKIPNPLIVGNVGSFFKNPIISKVFLKNLLRQYPNMPFYCHKNSLIKLSARWLIDHCYLKNYRFGNAGICRQQSLILINIDQKATSTEIIRLALYIHNNVLMKFHIFLEPEVQFIGSFGKINGMKLLSTKSSVLRYGNILS